MGLAFCAYPRLLITVNIQCIALDCTTLRQRYGADRIARGELRSPRGSVVPHL